MDPSYPIHTGTADCQDCYKCVRHCPVKAIRIEESKASVINEICILCGHCVEVCPSGAKKIRDDVDRVRSLIHTKQPVVASLAPSYVSEFPGVGDGRIIRALKRLGFSAVSETALGAQEVSAHVAGKLAIGGNEYYMSSACPAAVELVRKHYPSFHGSITAFKSPMQAHARLIKRHFGEETAVVFIGPCIAKKNESDHNPELVGAAITFKGLRSWFEREKIDPALEEPGPEDVFVPEAAREGAMYPVEGGMIAGIKAECAVHDRAFMSFSGVDSIQMALNGLEGFKPDRPVFLELLACKGGCINGPARLNRNSTVMKRYSVLQRSEYPAHQLPRKTQCDIAEVIETSVKKGKKYDEKDILRALASVGKYSREDELNCGGCGYNSCSDFAAALMEAKAEPEMCVTYMRKLAQKKANALLRAMPSGVVIVNDELKVVECNRNFAKIVGTKGEMIFDASPGMEGARLDRIIPFAHYFRSVLEDGEDILDKDIKFGSRILHASIFTIEKHRIAGGVFQDITDPAIQREQIIHKTQEVIENNLKTVQKIAYLLGENASETQIVLDSIVSSFSAELTGDKTGEKR